MSSSRPAKRAAVSLSPPRGAPGDWSAAQRHLRRVDPVLRGLIDEVGPCRIRPRRDYFGRLCRSIFSQQISTRIAAILFDRFCANFPRRRPTPVGVLKLLALGPGHASVLVCGLSRQKQRYLIDLATHFVDNRIPTRRLSRMSDEQVIEALTAVHGIGRWSAEMFLMFVLNRPDVLPVDDLGVRSAMKIFYKLRELPDAARARKIARLWSPWRTVGTWYLWRGLELHQLARKPSPNNSRV